jgi:hypothetical protein
LQGQQFAHLQKVAFHQVALLRIQGKIDTLDGLKENVIVGRLIPAGAGGMLARFRQIADMIIEEQQKSVLSMHASGLKVLVDSSI